MFQFQHAVDTHQHRAIYLHDSMAGSTTHDFFLVTRVVRCHWDRHHMAGVRAAFETRYKMSLAERIRSKTDGTFRELLLICIDEDV